MTAQEGVIKFDLQFEKAKPIANHDFTHLNRWHRCFKKAGILGQNPKRYDGLGFGNISERIDDSGFLISGTQTGHLQKLSAADYALVTDANILSNRIMAKGQVKPSSEALTHAAVYALDSEIRYVFHVHSPHIWKQRSNLGLAETDADIPYGSVEMANEMKRLYEAGAFQHGNVFAMAGHQDGIVGFAASANQAGESIMNLLDIVKNNISISHD